MGTHEKGFRLDEMNEAIDDVKQDGEMREFGKTEWLKHKSGYSRCIDEENRFAWNMRVILKYSFGACMK